MSANNRWCPFVSIKIFKNVRVKLSTGQSLVEVALILALIGIVAIVVLSGLGRNVQITLDAAYCGLSGGRFYVSPATCLPFQAHIFTDSLGCCGRGG